MSSLRFHFNGIDAATGRYLVEPLTPREVAPLVRQEARYGMERPPDGAASPTKVLPYGISAQRLDTTGWAVVFSRTAPPILHESLSRLLEHRRCQAKDLYREYTDDNGYHLGESKLDFVERLQGKPECVLPDGSLPYYMLIVGGPKDIPFSFQYQLDLHYAVGRLHFDTPEEYGRYADSVVAAESSVAKRKPKVFLFCPGNDGEPAMASAYQDLVSPIARQLERGGRCELETVWQDKATRHRLSHELHSSDPPDVLFTASHGICFNSSHPQQCERQGALICEEWPGYGKKAIFDEHCFGAAHMAASARLRGMIAFNFACFSAGTQKESSYLLARQDLHHFVGKTDFTARLPQQMLAQGALAVVGHVDIAWHWSFRWREAGFQCGVFENVLAHLIAGQPIGHVLHEFDQRYATVSADLDDEIRRSTNGNSKRLSELWIARNDMRNFIVLGDPAVCVPVKLPSEEEWP